MLVADGDGDVTFLNIQYNLEVAAMGRKTDDMPLVVKWNLQRLQYSKYAQHQVYRCCSSTNGKSHSQVYYYIYPIDSQASSVQAVKQGPHGRQERLGA